MKGAHKQQPQQPIAVKNNSQLASIMSGESGGKKGAQSRVSRGEI